MCNTISKKLNKLYNKINKLCFKVDIIQHDNSFILAFETSFTYIEMVALITELEHYFGAKFYKCVNKDDYYTIELKYEV